jgi:hypothetical protein
MSEFLFRNLSVKLFPEAALADELVCVCCSYQYQCDGCTLCTGGETRPPGMCTPCTDIPDTDCGPCTGGCTDTAPPCGIDSCETGTHCIDSVTVAVLARRSAAVVRGELEYLRAELRQVLGRPLEEDRRATVAEARSVEEIDRLREVLLGAVAELDQRRAEIEANPPEE